MAYWSGWVVRAFSIFKRFREHVITGDYRWWKGVWAPPDFLVGISKKRYDVRRQGLVCAPLLRMRITKKKGCWQQTCKVSQKSQIYLCITVEDLGNPFDQKKGCQSILTNRLDKMVAIYTRSLGNFLWTNLVKSFYIYCVSRWMLQLFWWWWWSSLKMRTECDMWWQGLARAPTPPQVIPAIWSRLDFNWHRRNILNIERETFRCNNQMTLCVWMFCHPPQLVS